MIYSPPNNVVGLKSIWELRKLNQPELNAVKNDCVNLIFQGSMSYPINNYYITLSCS